ncbi:MAG TPA: AAA family ATPase [Candidatus Dojkabacteria bacterium]|nr:AAA family ATPase [Candidatus Dojkabacteria bacterium]
MELPTIKVKALYKSPRKLLIYSPPKAGKTTAVSMLPDSLIVDLEQGSDFLDAMKVKVNNIDDIRELIIALQSPGAPKYRYGIIDTTTKLEEMVISVAASMYRATPMGKNWGKLEDKITDDPEANILTLPNGGGYLYLREAYVKVSNALDSCFERVIYNGHLKDKVLEKAGKEVSAKDIDLTGKIRNIACAGADAIGYMYREGNKTMLSFKTSQDVICGARPEHLRDKEIVLLEYNEGKFTSHWDDIYID